ncbi:ABC transporter ATP-binding protein [Devosia submarina]|uniref:ABC transporter ATP-binding protein n=1 Tax=Devosia submarina TaxID=1173082 RepID=UPI0013002C34|nr:ABC transporter ATP-binding protein [Devosia submarina]
MNQPPDALLVSGLRVGYGGREVLKNLDLRVRAGEIYGLLGPNGAGKTTLIRSICGRVRPLGGTISIAGQPVSRKSLRRIGLVPQEIALYPHLTIGENLEVLGRLSGLSRDATRTAMGWATKAANLGNHLHSRVDILSGGWKRRANIAAAILHRPALLILDEPTVGVDVDARNALHDVILQLSHAGMGVLLTTHDLDQAETLCSSVGFLRSGTVAPQGEPRQLIETAFGTQKEIILELRQPPTEPQANTLLKSGFTPSNANLTWIMLGNASQNSAAELGAALDRAGMAVREIRFREPGLDSLFVRLSGKANQSVMEPAA